MGVLHLQHEAYHGLLQRRLLLRSHLIQQCWIHVEQWPHAWQALLCSDVCLQVAIVGLGGVDIRFEQYAFVIIPIGKHTCSCC